MSSMELLQYTESDREKVLAKYGRTPQNIQQDIENMKEWLRKQPHLPEIPEDKIIENFLIMNKFRIENVKEKLDMYYSIRQLLPQYFNVNPNSTLVQTVMYAVYALPLPKLTDDLYRVFLAVKIKDPNPDSFDPIAHAALTYHHIEMRLREDCSLGVIYVYDLAYLKAAHLLKISPQHVKNLSFIGEKVLTAKVKAVHMINAPPFIDTFLSFVKEFFKPKVFERIFVHKTLDTFYEMLPRKMLPKDYGGEEKSILELTDEWAKTFLKYNSVFEHLQNIKVDESLRPGKPLQSDMLGIQGSFRKLDLD